MVSRVAKCRLIPAWGGDKLATAEAGVSTEAKVHEAISFKGEDMAGKTSRNNMVPRFLIPRLRSGRAWVIGIIAGVFLLAGRVSGQFMMQPMKLELMPRAGDLVRMDLQIQNTSMTESHVIDFRVLDLTQEQDGSWEMVEPGSNFDTSKLSSCKDWIKLGVDTVQLRPMTILPVRLEMRVPRNVRGFYGAAIHAAMTPTPRVVQGRVVNLAVHMLVPVLVQIEGWAPPHKVELTDVGMRFKEQVGEEPATSLVTLAVSNNGGTYSRLKGKVRVSTLSGDNWRRITEADFLDCSIIPGVKLTLESDIERSLPSGRYKLEGGLFVDGRRTKLIEKEIDFIGDKRLSRAAADAALDLKPLEVVVESVPGGVRTATLTVTNASNEAVNVTTAVSMPPVLMGVGLPDTGLRGEDLNCAPWVEVMPKEFTIAAQRSQNLRIVTKMPNPTSMHAWYYALLRLRAIYVDGQNAGATSAYICVSNKQVQAKPEANAWPLQLEQQSGSEYSIKSTFLNAGGMHFRPSCLAVIRTPEGGFLRSLALSGEPEGVMLPLEPRIFSGVLNFAGIRDGLYRLEATLRYGSQDVVSVAVPISVLRQADQWVVGIATPQEFEQKVGVKWR